MKYYIIAGEASGDLHAANLIRELRMNDSSANIRAWGGDRMEKAGAVLVKHYKDLAFMGFLEVLKNLRTILKNLKFCKRDIQDFQPDVIILVDYPGFNLRIAEWAHKQGIRVYYYISPQIWAWKQSRVKQIRRDVDRMFVILPFEKAFYQRFGVEVDFVGHPLLDAIDAEIKDHPIVEGNFKSRNQLPDKPLIALLPGSRKQEITIVLHKMLSVVRDFPDYQFVIAGVNTMSESFYRSIIGNHPVKLVYGQTHELLRSSEAALVTSGTATLETALLNVPEVVCYQGGYISYLIARLLIKVKYISLVNLIMDRVVVKELIQDQLNTDNLKYELDLILNHRVVRNRIASDYAELRHKLGDKGASHKAARMMQQYLKKY
ncbi:MAG: lipid-A-disaccharide synthase [Bacteroidota bacterium]|nr:lipid-A-disaccharide synthase [Bacteroidota bacterium]